jgi:hypothetical protein
MMPISIACPSCSAKLKAPDSSGGKSIKCPKCGEAVRVPVADDVDEAEETPRKRPASRVDDDDERPRRKRTEDDDDDRPRRRKRPSEKSSAMMPILIAGGLGLLVLVAAGIGLAMWLSSNSEPKNAGNPAVAPPAVLPNTGPVVPPVNPLANPPAPKAKPPAGWERFNDPLSEVELHFPGKQPKKDEAASEDVAKAINGAADQWVLEADGGKAYALTRMTFPAAEVRVNKPEKLLFDAMVGMGQGLGAMAGKYEPPVFENGRVSRVVVFDIPKEKLRVVLRGMVVGNRVYLAFVTGDPKIAAKDKDIVPFLSSLQPSK